MTANMLEHRRARAFAEALEAHRTEPHQGDRRPDSGQPGGSTAMAELLSMADALGALPEPELSTEARTLQRAQLMAAFERDWTGSPAARVPQQRRHRAVRSGARLRWGRGWRSAAWWPASRSAASPARPQPAPTPSRGTPSTA
ncbi:hypothetical protein ACFQ0T_23750 [Kitasatospora gansuensis]